ncbi:ABC transporter ATP-binding protein [Prauserella muralis]|uniref:ABC transporter ATP-binding protein n=1 Tax=Prauserella muralis TaxID=588067 RepID=A0A2V4ASE2_9PSEU|nr:ATP-binding cassette domain-containing protein [Prauserella muralis]PXY22461.1 ABC transporter ATP-binding protein [Prauserella muralis]TWE28138.1 putative ABC transport system ATP-binding protein [Prauserella muralis]
MREPPPIFRLRDIGVDYRTPAGTVTGVAGVTLDIPRTGLTVLAGPSGSGKSTLLRVLGLFDRPVRGELTFAGLDTGALSHRRRRALRREQLGLIFQNPADNLLPHLTVGDNLRAAAQSAGHPCDPELLLAPLGLSGTGPWRVPALSGGQQQRLAFGCALARRSSVILADEPTSQLDDASAEKVLDTLRYLVDQDFAVLVTSHDERLIGLAARVARLRDGRLEEVVDGAGG